MSEAKTARLAATVILVRRADRDPFEIFLTRRPQGMVFLGGMYCFPGGTVRNEDCSPDWVERCHGVTPAEARRILGAHFAPTQALGFWIAAVRELFEETGILLAKSSLKIGESCSGFPGPEALDRLYRALMQNATTLHEILETEDLLCDLSRLRYLSHWQTPSGQPIRFDTRFFLAVLPEHQSPLTNSPEVTHSIWVTPDEALKRFEKNKLPMIFPTFASIRRLADFDSLESVFAHTNPAGSSIGHA